MKDMQGTHWFQKSFLCFYPHTIPYENDICKLSLLPYVRDLWNKLWFYCYKNCSAFEFLR